MQTNQTSERPLLSAARLGNLKLVEELCAGGEDANHQDEEGKTALMIAIECKHHDVALDLIQLGTKLDIVDVNGDNALLLTLKTEQYDLTNFLLDSPQDVNIADKNGKTALHLATERKQKDIVLKLFSFDVNVDAEDSEGQTPLILACESGDFEIASLLLQHNSNFRKKDIRGHCSRDYAIQGGFTLILRMIDDLEAHGLEKLPEVIDNIRNTAPGQVSASHVSVLIPNKDEENKNVTANDENRKLAEQTPEVIKHTGRFVSSNALQGKTITRSGVTTITATRNPNFSEAASSSHPGRLWSMKASYAVGHQNLNSVPEPVQQLHGIYAKYQLKEAKEENTPPKKF